MHTKYNVLPDTVTVANISSRQEDWNEGTVEFTGVELKCLRSATGGRLET